MQGIVLIVKLGDDRIVSCAFFHISPSDDGSCGDPARYHFEVNLAVEFLYQRDLFLRTFDIVGANSDPVEVFEDIPICLPVHQRLAFKNIMLHTITCRDVILEYHIDGFLILGVGVNDFCLPFRYLFHCSKIEHYLLLIVINSFPTRLRVCQRSRSLL